jgi:hypothetical protein
MHNGKPMLGAAHEAATDRPRPRARRALFRLRQAYRPLSRFDLLNRDGFTVQFLGLLLAFIRNGVNSAS